VPRVKSNSVKAKLQTNANRLTRLSQKPTFINRVVQSVKNIPRNLKSSYTQAKLKIGSRLNQGREIIRKIEFAKNDVKRLKLTKVQTIKELKRVGAGKNEIKRSAAYIDKKIKGIQKATKLNNKRLSQLKIGALQKIKLKRELKPKKYNPTLRADQVLKPRNELRYQFKLKPKTIKFFKSVKNKISFINQSVKKSSAQIIINLKNMVSTGKYKLIKSGKSAINKLSSTAKRQIAKVQISVFKARVVSLSHIRKFNKILKRANLKIVKGIQSGVNKITNSKLVRSIRQNYTNIKSSLNKLNKKLSSFGVRIKTGTIKPIKKFNKLLQKRLIKISQFTKKVAAKSIKRLDRKLGVTIRRLNKVLPFKIEIVYKLKSGKVLAYPRRYYKMGRKGTPKRADYGMQSIKLENSKRANNLRLAKLILRGKVKLSANTPKIVRKMVRKMRLAAPFRIDARALALKRFYKSIGKSAPVEEIIKRQVKTPNRIKTFKDIVKQSENALEDLKDSSNGQVMLQKVKPPLDKPTVIQIEQQIKSIGKSKNKQSLIKKTKQVKKVLVKKQEVILSQLKTTRSQAMFKFAKTQMMLSNVLFSALTRAAQSQYQRLNNSITAAQRARQIAGTRTQQSVRQKTEQKAKQEQKVQQKVQQKVAQVAAQKLGTKSATAQIQIISSILATSGAYKLLRTLPQVKGGKNSVMRGLKRYRQAFSSWLKSKMFVYTPDLASLLFNQKVKNKKQAYALLQRGRIFSGLEARYIVTN
jgi:hypothetical protein